MKVLGYCADCQIPLCRQEIGVACGRCGKLNKAMDLKDVALEPVAKQTGKDLLVRHYKIQSPGIKTGGTPKRG